MQPRSGAPCARRTPRRLAIVAVAALLAVALAVPASAGAEPPARSERGTTPASPLSTLPTSLLVTLRPGADPAATDAAAADLGLARVAWNPDARTVQYVALAPEAPAGTLPAAGSPGHARSRADAVHVAKGVDGRERARLARLGAGLRRLPGVQTTAVPVELAPLEDPPPGPPVDPTPTPEPTPPPPVAGPNDTYWGAQWGPDAVGARGGWALTRGRPEIVVAVLDTGVDLAHPDLKGRLIPGTDIGSGDGTPADPVGHGTHVTGIIAAASGNALGVSGVAPQVVVMPVKVMNDAGSIWDVAVAEGITWAVARGARVVNLSLGGANASASVNAAIDAARAHGAVVVAAAGNTGGPVSQPAAHPPVVAVAAVKDLGPAYGEPGTPARYVRDDYSNYGDEVDVAAPGTAIASTWPKGTYRYLQGTSMATPFVSAIAALALARNPSLTAAEVETLLASTALDLGREGFDVETGWGLARADRAAWAVTPPTPDGAAPYVRISGITDGTMIRGTKTLTFSATDPSPIVALRIYRDGAYDRIRRVTSYATGWNTNGVKDGIHRWAAYGTDAGLAVGSAQARVLVANDRAVRSLRTSVTMTSTRRSLSRTITLGRTSPLVARFTAPAGTAVRLRLVSSSGKTIADVRGTGVAVIALSSVRYGRYSLRASASVARPGRTLALRADWFR